MTDEPEPDGLKQGRRSFKFDNRFTTGNVLTIVTIIATAAIWYAQMNSVAAQVPELATNVAAADKRTDSIDKHVSVLEAERADDVENRKEVIRRLRDLQQSVDAINNRSANK